MYGGALLRFLTRIGERYNVTLFHYRNHGAAYGRVLVGIDANDDDGVATLLAGIAAEPGFHSEEESDNEAYRLFLA